jgi:signal transduction histidine kinase
MQKNIPHRWQMTELSYPTLMLALLFFFTYGIFIRAPYIGLYFNPTDGRILQIYIPSESLHLDDTLIKVGDISVQDHYENNRQQGLFNGVKDGETVTIIVNRNGEEITIPWKIPGFNQAEFYARFFNVWWLAYIFWFFGFTAQMFVRPKDTRWRLLVASNYLTGLWVILGALSARHLWESSILLHAVTWSLLPIYLHFHWLFPKPLTSAPKPVVVILYAASLPLILGELFQIFPRTFFALGFLLMLTGIVVLQVIHFIRHREERRDVRLAAFAVLLAILPTIALSVFGVTGVVPLVATLGLLTLPFMPLAYLFIIYRSQLGGLEMRANRFISLYAFLIILSTILIILITPVLSLQIPDNISVLLALSMTLFTAFISILIFPAFQAFVEKRLLGIELPYQNLQETYSSRITTSASLSSLLQLLNDEVFPSLLVRQFAFIQVFSGNLKALLTRNINPEQLPHESDMNELTSQAGKYLPNISPNNDWVRLILPLKVGDSFIGFWLLGRRDPDDLYPQAEILILQSIANQTAIALSNILHTEQLRKMYQLDIERYEKERMHLALELHDSVLNELAVLRTNSDETGLSPKFQTSYEEVTHRLREIVSGLRPPMLMYGLKPAVEELADNLMERSGDSVKITVDIQAIEERVPQNIEQHLFRIVQEACENALRHSHAVNIRIYGSLNPQKVDLTIEDDGTGFDSDDQLELDTLLANNHFGLAGIVERAMLINAEVKINSIPKAGTQIKVVLNTYNAA